MNIMAPTSGLQILLDVIDKKYNCELTKSRQINVLRRFKRRSPSKKFNKTKTKTVETLYKRKYRKTNYYTLQKPILSRMLNINIGAIDQTCNMARMKLKSNHHHTLNPVPFNFLYKTPMLCGKMLLPFLPLYIPNLFFAVRYDDFC